MVVADLTLAPPEVGWVLKCARWTHCGEYGGNGESVGGGGGGDGDGDGDGSGGGVGFVGGRGSRRGSIPR